jgi:acyl dehydratase
MADQIHFEDLRLGDKFRSPSRTITRDEVARFATLTGDLNPLHLDEAFAAESPFGRPIAHGLLGLSFVAGLVSDSPRIETVALLAVSHWRFIRPIYYGDQIHVVSHVVELEPNGRKRGRVVWKRDIVNQQGALVQEGIFETLVARRPLARSMHPTSLTKRDAPTMAHDAPAMAHDAPAMARLVEG